MYINIKLSQQIRQVKSDYFVCFLNEETYLENNTTQLSWNEKISISALYGINLNVAINYIRP